MTPRSCYSDVCSSLSPTRLAQSAFLTPVQGREDVQAIPRHGCATTFRSGRLMRLLDAGVEVRFCDLPQIEGPTGRFMLQQLAAVAELEAGLIGDRTKKALTAAKARGVQLGGWRGKDTLTAATRARAVAVRQALAADRATDLAGVIRHVMTEMGDGASWRQIGAELTRRGIMTPSGKAVWQPVQIQRVLQRAG